MSAHDLADLLHRASLAHHEYERTHGPDPSWWDWYAAFMTRSADITIRHRTDRDLLPSPVSLPILPERIVR